MQIVSSCPPAISAEIRRFGDWLNVRWQMQLKLHQAPLVYKLS